MVWCSWQGLLWDQFVITGEDLLGDHIKSKTETPWDQPPTGALFIIWWCHEEADGTWLSTPRTDFTPTFRPQLRASPSFPPAGGHAWYSGVDNLLRRAATSASELALSSYTENSCERFIHHRMSIIGIKTPPNCDTDLHWLLQAVTLCLSCLCSLPLCLWPGSS